METAVSQNEILDRVISGESHRLTADGARALLEIGFNETDKERMRALAEKNQNDTLCPLEREELANYRQVGNVLALLHSRARSALD